MQLELKGADSRIGDRESALTTKDDYEDSVFDNNGNYLHLLLCLLVWRQTDTLDTGYTYHQVNLKITNQN